MKVWKSLGAVVLAVCLSASAMARFGAATIVSTLTKEVSSSGSVNGVGSCIVSGKAQKFTLSDGTNKWVASGKLTFNWKEEGGKFAAINTSLVKRVFPDVANNRAVVIAELRTNQGNSYIVAASGLRNDNSIEVGYWQTTQEKAMALTASTAWAAVANKRIATSLPKFKLTNSLQ